MKQIIIYTKDYCPYCKSAKSLLTSKSVEFKEINMQEMSEGELEVLSKETKGYSTVPQIFIGSKFIGGFNDLKALEDSGKLDEMLKE
ncbi:glutaredoxin 3 [archaeon]|nr:glutaredoxin 3 [archaeon]|tara:strand:+ start:4883 stop:5143 length:261 start_codon:yes stop_codon:yes gene_type:complete